MAVKREKGGVTVIRREEIIEGGHHGGAWKVAYADFVTAMMAFFLLMWLLNATTDEQRRGLADYFSPMNPIARGASGAGMPFGGKTPYETGDLVSNLGVASPAPGRKADQPDSGEAGPEAGATPSPSANAEQEAESDGARAYDPTGAADTKPERKATKKPGAGAADSQARVSPDAKALALVGAKTQAAAAITARAAADEAAMKAEQERRERAAFDEAAKQIRDAIRADKQLQDIANQIAIDQTPEGLRVQLLDEEKKPMFGIGSAVMAEAARRLLVRVTPILAGLPEPIAISGHTDAAPYRGTDKTNWELSSERANTTRRILVDSGLPEARFQSVTGKADRDPLLPSDPMAPANRRIAIVILRSAGGAKPSGS